MARPIILKYKDETVTFVHKKIDRSRLYGKRKRIAMDPAGKPCTRAEITEDGAILVKKGMAAQAYFDMKDSWLPYSSLTGMDLAGKPLKKCPSTLGAAQVLQGPVSTEQLLYLEVMSVYQLSGKLPPKLRASLQKGDVFMFVFNYRGDYHNETAFLVSGKEGCFALMGNIVEPQWLELKASGEELFTEEDVESDDLDFEMF